MEGSRLGPYRLLAELGSGGMGKVYRAEVIGTVSGLGPGCAVALKVIHAHLLETPGFFKRFLREADLGRTIEHVNVVRTYDCDALLHDGVQQNFLVMEYVEGQTLRDLLRELERVPEELCRHVGREVAKGLAAIHEAGVVHRDLKPENVLITPEQVVKIMDLGVARLQTEAVRLSQTGGFVGSLEYAAPEQFRSGGVDADGRADLHALGVVLYELSTAQHPYRDEDAARVLRRILDEEPRRAGELNPQLSAFFEEVVHTLMAKDQEQRFDCASDVARVLDEGEASEWWQSRAQALRIETHRPLRRIRIPRETALYGREDDLTRLRAFYETAKANDGQVLLLEGEAGIGKTRLVDEFVGQLRQEGEDVNFLFGSYPPGGAATAAGAFSTAYREHFGAQGLDETLQIYLSATPLLIPAFAALLKGDATPTGAQSLTKDSLQTVFVHATRALAAERPTIILIDDLHFAPEEGRALFASLALAVPGHRILLVGTMRPGVPEAWTANVTRLDHAAHRTLSRLGPKDLARLLEEAFRSHRLAEELSHRIALKSDGNPFFAFEIIQGLRDGQFITQEPDGTWATTRAIHDIHVPSSVMDLVRARIADLDDDERSLLEVASCCGFEFDPLLLASVLDQPPIQAIQRLAKVEQRYQLVRSAGRRFVFDHHQLQEALYEGLPQILREHYHAAIATTLEGRAPAGGANASARLGEFAVDLCEHYLKGAQGGEALRYLDGALTHLEEGYLNDQAIALADRALAVHGLLVGPSRARALVRKNDRLHLMGHRAEQRAVLNEARLLAEAAGDPRLLRQLEDAEGRLHNALGYYSKAASCYERALALTREVGDREQEALAAGNLGRVLNQLGRHEESLQQCEYCLEIARETGAVRANVLANSVLGDHLLRVGQYAKSREHFERALALSREQGDRQGEASATGNLGNLFDNQGLYDESREYYARWLAMANDMGDRQGAAAATGNLGVILLRTGVLPEAAEHFERHCALAREIGDRQGEINATANLALICEVRGEYAGALDHNERALHLARAAGIHKTETLIEENLGGVLRLLGRHDEARALLERLLAQARASGNRRSEGHALDELALIAMQEGDLDRALQHAETGLALERALGVVERKIGCEALLGSIEMKRGHVEAAVLHLETALGLAEEVNAPETVVVAKACRALLPGGGGPEAAAALDANVDDGSVAQRLELRFLLWRATSHPVHLGEAKRLLDYLVEHAPEEYRDSMLKNVRLNRDIMESWAEHGEKAVGEGEAE